MLRGAFKALVFINISLYLCGCDAGGHGAGPRTPDLSIELMMYNGAGIFDNVTYTVADVYMYNDAAQTWYKVGSRSEPIIVLQDSVSQNTLHLFDILNIGDVEHYRRLRFTVRDVEISSINRHIVLHPNIQFEYETNFPQLNSSQVVTYVIDLNAAASFGNAGTRSSPSYYLRNKTRLAGNIDGRAGGRVLNGANLTIASCIRNSDTITTAVVRSQDGAFSLGFLPQGTYDVAIADSTGASYFRSIDLKENQQFDLGDIVLK